MSFKKKSSNAVNLIGARPSVHDGQFLISSGIESFDRIIGDGIPLHSIMLIKQDRETFYSKLILKYFCSQGLVSGNPLAFCGENVF